MRRVLIGVAAAVSIGVLVGLVARLGMALVAIAAGHESQFSAAGTATIVMIYALAMLPGAVAAAFVRGKVRWLLPVAGGLLLVVPAVGVASEEIGDVEGLAAARMALLALTSLLVFATIPAATILTVRTVDRWSARERMATATAVGQPVDAPA